jgi:hypothetical protein
MAVAVLDGNRVRAELDGLGVTQTTLAKFVRIPKADVSRALSGHPLAPETVYRICLGIDQMKRGLR